MKRPNTTSLSLSALWLPTLVCVMPLNFTLLSPHSFIQCDLAHLLSIPSSPPLYINQRISTCSLPVRPYALCLTFDYSLFLDPDLVFEPACVFWILSYCYIRFLVKMLFHLPPELSLKCDILGLSAPSPLVPVEDVNLKKLLKDRQFQLKWLSHFLKELVTAVFSKLYTNRRKWGDCLSATD